MTDRSSAGEPTAGHREPVTLALIGLVVAVLLIFASAVPGMLRSTGDDGAAPVSIQAAATIQTATTAPATSAPTTVATETAATTSVTTPTTTTTTPTTTPPPTTPPTTEPPAADVPESIAIVLGGKIYLGGAVPDQAARDEIVQLVAAIFGEDNVVDNYVINPRASDPGIGNVRVDDPILFAPESARISPEIEPLLNQGLALLTLRPAATFLIEGHTDSRGSEEYNLELSQARADAIVGWYTDQGVDPSRLTAIGKGATEPIANNDTRAGRDRNRRIEVTIDNLLLDPG